MELIIAVIMILTLYMVAEALYERKWYKNVYTDITFEKEYMEFVSLLRLYINSQTSNCKLVHLIYSNETSVLLDEDKI